MAVGVMRTSAGVEGVVVDALLAWTKAISEEGYLEKCVQLGEWGMMFLGGVGQCAWSQCHYWCGEDVVWSSPASG